MMKRVAIIGAGIVGSSLAFRLAASGADVTIVDRGEPGAGTSARSFAWINSNQKLPRDYFELNYAGLKEHYCLAEELGEAPWLHPGGNLVWTGDPARYDELRKRVERLQSWDYPAEWLNAGDVNRDLEPNVRFSGPTLRVAWFPREAWLDGPGYVRCIIDRARSQGAIVRGGVEVNAIEQFAGGVRVSLANGDTIETDAVVNAAGPAADEIAALVGRTLPLAPTRGLLVRVHTGRPLISRILQSSDIDLRPDGDGYLVLHHNSIDPLIGERPSVPLDDQHVRELLKRARKVLPEIQGCEATETRVGIRPFPRDGISCVGAVSDVNGYYEAVTHSGVTLGPLLGRLLADEILNGTIDPIVEPFRADRFC
jgi:glycine/D-amino acid oxidase-like deaminating enzyme